jgi:hypothetical protein
MSSISPAVVLYSSDGTELTVVSGSVVPASTRALLISGQNPSGDALYVPSAAQGALGIVNMSNDYIVQSNATVTTSGSTFVTANYYGTQEIAIIVNVGTVTGTGSITYTIQEVDPGNNTTLFGNSASTSAISTGNAPAVFTAVLNSTTSPVVRVSWVVTGTFSASIYTTVVSKTTPVTQAVSGTVTANNASVSTTGTAVPASATFVGGLVTTAAESGLTNGDLYSLNLTTAGQLRIDGVYPTAAAAPSTDAMYVAGAVTTAAPTYTTGQMDPLSMDTSGNLRVLATQSLAGTLAQSWYTRISDGTNGPVAVKPASTAAVATDPALVVAISPNNTVTTSNSANGNTAAAPPAQATYVGALVTTAAESGLTSGDMYPFNLTTTGQLRIDSAYPLATAVATAVDMTQVGGVVTTSAPSGYANNTINALSLSTAGNLRVDGSTVTQPVTGTGTAGTPATGVVTVQGISGGTAIPVSGTFTTDKSSTSSLTQVTAATSSTSILASNANRVSATFYNNSTAILFLAFGATASTTAFTVRVMPNSYYDLPITYTGAISGIWNAVNGNVCVTELTP